MFDDLHDPDPRPPSIARLAAVTTRGRALRRRRLATIGGAVALTMTGLAVGTFAAARDDDARHIVPASTPGTVESTTRPSSPPTTGSPDTSIPATAIPPTTPPPDTTVLPSTAAPTTSSVVTTSSDAAGLETSTTAAVEPPLTVFSGFVIADTGVGLDLPYGVVGDEAVARLSEQLGEPTADSGWGPLESSPSWACASFPETRTVTWGGLQIVLEPREPGAISNWRYTGFDPAAPQVELEASSGVTIGSTRADVLAAYNNKQDFGDVIDTYDGGELRFGMEGDVVTWFGVIFCGH